MYLILIRCTNRNYCDQTTVNFIEKIQTENKAKFDNSLSELEFNLMEEQQLILMFEDRFDYSSLILNMELAEYHQFKYNKTNLKNVNFSPDDFIGSTQFINKIVELILSIDDSPKLINPALEFLLSTEVEDLNCIEVYAFLKFLSWLSDVLYDNSQDDLLLPVSSYGLYLIKKHKLEKFKYLQTDLIFRNALVFYFRENNNSFESLLMKANESIIDYDISYAEYLKSYLLLSNTKNNIVLHKIDLTQLSDYEKIMLELNHGISKLYTSPNESLLHFNNASNFFQDDECFILKNILDVYSAIACFNSGDIIETKKFTTKIERNRNCYGDRLLSIRFANINYLDDIKHEVDPHYNREVRMDSLLVLRDLAKRLLSDNINHLSDFYVINSTKILNNFDKNQIIEIEVVSQLVGLLNEAKQIELKAKRSQEEKTEARENNKEIKALLKEVNNFQDTSGYDNPAYSKLFKLMIQEYLDNQNKPTTPIQNLELTDHIDDIMKGDHQFLELMSYDTQYAGYTLNQKGLITLDINRQKLDSLLDLSFQKIRDKKDMDDLSKSIRQMLDPDQFLDPDKPILLLVDGKLASFPMHLVFDQPVRQHFSMGEYLQEEKQNLSKGEMNIFSYSDRETLRSRDARKYTELPYAYEETLEIADNIKLDVELYTGSETIKEKVLESMDTDILHLASHAISNTGNKYDNYIVTRTKDGKTDKLYGYEIEESSVAPKVVILSACDTGIGQFTIGAGTYSISRSFLAAGTDTVIKSLWKVNDKSTKAFMTQLYDYWNLGHSLQESLYLTRDAMDKNPAFTHLDWAGFILEGNGNIYVSD